jgi:hypothetical protein
MLNEQKEPGRVAESPHEGKKKSNSGDLELSSPGFAMVTADGLWKALLPLFPAPSPATMAKPYPWEPYHGNRLPRQLGISCRGNFARGIAGRNQARKRMVERIPTSNKKGKKGYDLIPISQKCS